MGSGFAKMKKQARLLEDQVEKMRLQMQAIEFTASSAGGLVTVIINGEKELKRIDIKPECVDPEDLEGLQDLIKSAMDAAYAKLSQEASPMGLPGNFSLPF
ncbi:MAG: YbaB/EbfC family nucleoid-associated protein [Simkania sp.]|nr:YbaB/EbfC family nucleoid-associated protein [Simkania sp.]